MGLRHRFLPHLPVVVVLALLGTTFAAMPVAGASPPSGYRVLTGRHAADFRIPSDVRLTRSWRDQSAGLTFSRYQQYAAPLGVYAKGAQLTVASRGARQMLVIGSHYPDLRVAGRAMLSAQQAIGRAAADRRLVRDLLPEQAALLRRRAELRVEPETGRLFYLVESGSPGVHTFHEIDAQSGAVIDAWEAIQHANGMGTGIKADRKALLGDNPISATDNLTSKIAGVWRMQSVDGQIVTYDAKRRGLYGPGSGLKPMSDNAKTRWRNDNDWKNSYQRAAVDAQYYAAQTHAFYQDLFGFDLVADCPFGAIRSVVHFDPFSWDGIGYSNAFWDGFDYYMVYGDGDGSSMRAFSAGLDVVTHELSHAVTQCRASLDYQDEPGALNEAFSDIMASAAEWALDEPLSSNCRREVGQQVCADWWLGEDVIIGGPWYAFRSVSDPSLQGQPSHYSDRQYIGDDYDNGGVHVNSGIANHAFYLMVSGGRNARCSGPSDPTADCDVFVPPVSMADAQQIFFAAWGMLTEEAVMCEARNASVASAELLFPGSEPHRAATDLAWAAVGLDATGCDTQTDFEINLAGRSLALAPGTSGQLQLNLVRGSQDGQIAFSISAGLPATTTLTPAASPGAAPDDGTLITLDVASDAPSGVYPVVISATDGTATHHAAAALVVDADAPALQVSGVRIAQTGSVSTAGVVPLQVTWSAADAGSGLVSATLEHSSNATDWTQIGGPGTSGATTPFSTTAGAHHFRVLGGDVVGNDGASDVVERTLAEFQHQAATYAGGWSTATASTAWGTTRFSKNAGATAKFSFSGTAVAWVAQRGPKRGKAKVYLDGVLTKVDLYAGSLSARRIVFSASNLTAGPHKLKIVVKGTSGRPRVDVDGFVVLAP